MVSYLESIQCLRAQALTLPEETLPVCDGVGRVASEDIFSQEMVAPFTNSAMDGFALRSQDLNQTEFKVLGTIAAGDAPRTIPSEEGVWEIMTGAPMPSGFDTVIKVEDTHRLPTGNITLLKRPEPHENVRPAGEDFKPGDLVLARGSHVSTHCLLALATLGISKLKVFCAPKIAIVSTGNELVPYTNDSLPAGSIRNSTAPYLCAELRAQGADVKYHGIVGDKPDEFVPLLSSILESEPHVLITTGAVSMGKYDFVATALRDLGANLFFHKVAIRPGKPLLFARLKNTAIFGLPGNPISSAVGLRFFIEPFLRFARQETPERSWTFRLSEDVKKPEGLTCFFKARVQNSSLGEWDIKPLRGQSSALVHPLLQSNSWLVLPPEPSRIARGTMVSAYPLHAWGGFL